MKSENIRNFCIIAHIDHGKSTLADRFIEISGSVRKEKMNEQMLDSMDLERERGITIKLKAIRMAYKLGEKEYELNLIDTPGHVDFGYEVSRSLAACEGALLLVDASQGVQAQTLVNLQKARDHNLTIVPVVNKVDLPSAMPEEAALQLIDLGFKEEDICYTSGKTGKGVDILLEKIIKNIPPPKVENENESKALLSSNGEKGSRSEAPHKGVQAKALVFDSVYDDYRGVVVFVRVFSGSFKYNQPIKFLATGATANVIEIGYLSPAEVRGKELNAGEVGFIATGLKDIMQARVGDTVTLANQNPKPIAGYDVPVPMVFMSFYPSDSSRYLELREAMDRLSLNDAAFTFEPESIGAIGKGFRCGFLGLLHSDIVRERIEREFNIDLITTSPSVKYILEKTDGEVIEIKSAAEFPEVTTTKEVREPWAALDVYVTSEYLSGVMDLCKRRRSIYLSTKQIDGSRYRISYEIPLKELIIDFYDKLKSISSGYASIDYKIIDYRTSEVVKLDVLIAGDVIHPLAQLVQKNEAHEEGKRIVEKLKDLIPRQQFSVSLQAAINEKVVAREDISPVRKDVTGYLYGGDVTRKNKLLDKQKKGKSRMKRFGKVDVPQDVFWKVMER